jgi:spore maturation protein CgeB
LGLGHEVKSFYWYEYFSVNNSALKRLFYKIQNKLIVGPIVKKLNSDIEDLANDFKPNMIFFYRGTHIFKKTLTRIKSDNPNCILAGYNNDDPFSDSSPKYLMRHFLKSMNVYDIMLSYRVSNLKKYKSLGLKNVQMLRSWFDKDRTYPITLSKSDKKKFECDVVFVGHYEDDGRIKVLESILKQNLSFKLYGPEWNAVLKGHPTLGHLYPVEYLRGLDYAKALSGAKIALCFLSKINNDTYTRRCFEIPACKTMMLSEYSDDLSNLFEEGLEAEFFRSKEQLIKKLNFYLKNDKQRRSVASNGYRRVFNDGHDIDSRMLELIRHVENTGDLNV